MLLGEVGADESVAGDEGVSEVAAETVEGDGSIVAPHAEDAVGVERVVAAEIALIGRVDLAERREVVVPEAAGFEAFDLDAGDIRYIDRGDYTPEPEPVKPKRERKPRAKFEEKYIKAARELRDRYLEQVNTGRMLPESSGKYDVGRALEATKAAQASEPERVEGLLDAA